MPTKIFEGLGPGTLVPQRGKAPSEEPSLGPDEGFVLSRVDGQTSLEEICLLVPFDEPVTMVILRRLWEIGAIEVPGVARTMRPARPSPSQTNLPQQGTPEPLVDAPTSKYEEKRTTKVARPAEVPPNFDKEAPVPLSAEQKARIDAFYAVIDTSNAFELLEVDRTVDDRGVKRAYFKLSKEFHPDRFFGRELGPYHERLTKIFQAIKAAFELLSHKDRRKAYEESANVK